MKVFSKQFSLFLLAMAIYTLVFRMCLSHFLTNSNPIAAGISSIVYGIIIFFTAFFLGKSDGQKNAYFDIGLRWNIGSMIIWTIVSLAWFYFGKPAQYEFAVQILSALFIWGIIAIIHVGLFLWIRRKTIKGIHRSEIFE